ncbi:hypothetical protein OROHE_002758 [Orobanche hederae]
MPSDQALVRLVGAVHGHSLLLEWWNPGTLVDFAPIIITALMKLRLHFFSRHPLLRYINNFVSILLGPNPAFAHHSCSYVLHSATSSDINARRHAVYSSMNADKKASLLLARRTASEQFSYNSATCLIRIFQSHSTLWAPPCIARVCPCCDLHIEYVMFNKISKWCSPMEYVINFNVAKYPDPLLQPPKSDVQNY